MFLFVSFPPHEVQSNVRNPIACCNLVAIPTEVHVSELVIFELHVISLHFRREVCIMIRAPERRLESRDNLE